MVKPEKRPFLGLCTTCTQLQPPKRGSLTGYLGSSPSKQAQNGVFTNTVKSETVHKKRVSVHNFNTNGLCTLTLIVYVK